MARKHKEPETIYRPSTVFGLQNITEGGQAPDTRLTDARKALDIASSLILADSKQEAVDAEILRMVTGCAPFSNALLKQNAQSWRANFSSRIAKAYLSTALTQVWDVIASAHPKCGVTFDSGNIGQEKADEAGKIVTEEFDRLNERDRDLNYMFQRSQWDMMLYGYGPVMWMDKLDFRAKAIPKNNLHVPRNTKSNVNEWELCVVQVPYKVHEIYAYIKGDSATKRGWNVQEGIRAIIAATPKETQDALGNNWMAYEQAIRQNDIWFGNYAEEVTIDWVFVKEFDGKITKGGVVHNGGGLDWIYHNIGEYDNWHQAIAPMYQDIGDGTHYGVKGLGVECASLLAVYDRIQCQIMDSAFIVSSMHFKSNGGTDFDKQSVINMGPFILHPQAVEHIQTQQLGPGLQAAIAAKTDLTNTLTANLAQYRPQIGQKEGNPPTARQVDFEAENLNTLGRSQITRYWDQLDDFWNERYRRAINQSLTKGAPGGEEALEFQDRCKKRGVPMDLLSKATVRATRTIGWGNNDSRRQTLERMLMRLPLYNETGRQNILKDITTADVGFTNSFRYCPPEGEYGPDEMEQKAEAQDKVTTMKVGLVPVMTPKQNPYIYATTFLEAAAQAAQSLQQGGNLMDVYNFLAVSIPAIQQHMQRMANDPTRKQVLDVMQKQLQQVQQIFQQLQQQIQQQMRQQQQEQMQAQQQAQQMNIEQQLKMRESQMNAQRKNFEAQERMKLKQQQTEQKLSNEERKVEQDLRIKDITAAADIHLKKRAQDEKPKPKTPASD